MKEPIVKYKIGLAVIGLFTLVLLIVVVVQASATKEDNNTYNKALSASNILNDYIDSNDSIPSSLTAAGVNNAPSTISYQKLSSSSYKFCVDYKATSSDFSATGVVSNLETYSNQGSVNYSSTSSSSTLYINSTWHKGENCQTIKPIIYTDQGLNPGGDILSPGTSTNPASQCVYNYNESESDNQAYYQCLDDAYDTQSD